MSRSASMQFTLLTRQEAERYLARCSRSGDTVGDRIAAQRRLMDVTTPEEREAARLDALLYGRGLNTTPVDAEIG